MIESFTITNHLGESLELILADPDSSGLAITSVTGLGQVTAKANLTKLAGSDYSVENSAVLGDRNIVFKIKYWGTDIEESRHKCDRIFPTKKKVTIVAKTDHRELMATGIVEKNEPDIFSEKSSCQVSILCADPFWYTLDETNVPFGGIEPLFEFPFHADISVDEGEETHMIEVGNIRTVKEKFIYYTGEAETGITLNIHAIGSVRNFVIYNVDLRQQISINDSIIRTLTGGYIQDGDDIIISTIKTQKYARLIRGGVEYNIINALGKTRDWFELSGGDNLFSYSASEGEYDMIINIKYRVSYKGL